MKSLFVVLVAIACVGFCSDSGTTGTCSWTLSSNTLTITGSSCKMGSYTLADGSQPPWFSDRTSIQAINVNYGVKKIGNYAFFGCSNLATLTIGDSVEEIGDSAFYGCSTLASIKFPENLEKVGEKAFTDCTNLKSVNLTQEDMDDIKDYAFSGCSKLETVLFPGIEKIKENVFKDCVSLKNIEIDSGVKKIQDNAFKGCVSLESIKLPSTLSEIDDGAFEDCISLKQVIYGGSFNPATGSNTVFKNCTSLELICVRQTYPYNNFCGKTTYQTSTSPELEPLLASQNHCYEAYICNSTYGILEERSNKTYWESRVGTACAIPYCDNETGAAYWSICNSTDVCLTDYYESCEDRDRLRYKAWAVVISFGNVTANRYNKTNMTNSIYSITKISYDYFASEISDEGYLLNVFYMTRSNTSAINAKNLLETALDKANCEKLYGLVCEADNISLIEGPEYNSAYHNYVSLFVLLLALIVSFVSH